MRTVLLLSLAAACGREPGGAAVSRAWPVLGTTMSAAAWGADTMRIGRALERVRDTVDRPLSGRAVAADSLRREIRLRTGVAVAAADLTEGDALDRAAVMLAGAVDSALLDIGGQFLWVGRQATRRPVGIADPANTLDALATVEMRGGSVSTSSQPGPPLSVTVLAASGVAADAWSTALLEIGCDRALALAPQLEAWQASLVCADSSGVRWTADLEGRVLVRPPRP